MSRQTRVLLYNWAPFNRDFRLAGGVSIYCRHLEQAFREQGLEVDFLYSGIDFQFGGGGARYQAVEQLDGGTRIFSIVNSDVPAPAFLAQAQPLRDVSSPAVEKAFARFLAEHGPYHAVHFQNLEGLTADCLAVAKQAGARVVLSLHNYWALCPQVNLWRRSEERCVDFEEGAACVSCLPERRTVTRAVSFLRRSARCFGKLRSLPDVLSLLWTVSSWLYRGGALTRRLIPRLGRGGKSPGSPARPYRERRERILERLAKQTDVLLAVSERTAQIYREAGLSTSKLRVQYIGTVAAGFTPRRESPPEAAPFHLAFIGPLRKEKGIFFLLDALESLPDRELASLQLTVAGRLLLDFDLEKRLRVLAKRLAHLQFITSYEQAELPRILQGVHLGIVSPLWEDNLPQVMLEFIGCGVPVLCSNRGGAQEYISDARYVFDPDRPGDFAAKLRALREEPRRSEQFARSTRPLISMEAHARELVAIYRGEEATWKKTSAPAAPRRENARA